MISGVGLRRTEDRRQRSDEIRIVGKPSACRAVALAKGGWLLSEVGTRFRHAQSVTSPRQAEADPTTGVVEKGSVGLLDFKS